MKLPNSERAYVPKQKLTEYLLSETHAVGKFKARFFRKLGFGEANAHLLQKEIINIARSQEIKESIPSNYGTKYIVDGDIKTTIGESVKIRTVWIIEKDQTQPNFITAYPV
ncbi:MAG: hypothetical protein A2Z11_03530 [Candidatus Woykebacteria bacterium RBG_16_43_9]|uniref:DUF6883 domain-containing protein n=1 Tax=Candidatus Woykebacteria bacterium RBG_16_43_9 TaxID=1802596 RepID=A0A1G1WCQ9_9BACT|nr:MAG: hypothetical protein A2Z11_03530 [Candidatus Woykebacteria bacterium RBG_16_43_9]